MRHWVREILADIAGCADDLSPELRGDVDRVCALVEERDVYAFRSRRLDDIAGDVSECVDLEEFPQLMWAGAVECGFEHVTVFLLRQGSGGAFRVRICTSYPKAWVARYQEKAYQFVDPVVGAALESNGPFEFSELPVDCPIVEAFWEDAGAHRIGRNGICVAFDLPSGARIGVTYATQKTDSTLRNTIRRNGSDAIALARIGAEAFAATAQRVPMSAGLLSEDELRFLYHLVNEDNPDQALNISPRYGPNSSLQNSIRNKLGVRTILQAVSIASANSWFDQLPYDIRDVARAFPELRGWDLICDSEG